MIIVMMMMMMQRVGMMTLAYGGVSCTAGC